MPGSSIQAAGAPLAFGSDAPVEVPDAVRRHVRRRSAARTQKGEPFGGWHPLETVTREQALAAYTLRLPPTPASPKASSAARRGRARRLLVLDADLLMADPADLRRIRVLETWIGGQKLYDADGDGRERPADAPDAGRTGRPLGKPAL